MRSAFTSIAMALCLAFAWQPGARAQSLNDRLSEDQLGSIEPGTYLAGDNLKFSLDQEGNHLLLRFDGVPEVFVLYSDPGTLGGRILKYDSGETAMRVTGWGGLTIYTDSAPEGLPAARMGDSLPPSLPAVSLADMQNAAQDEEEHLAYVRRLRLSFAADWTALASDPALRALAFDAMENAARGIERFTAKPAARQVLAQHADAVLVTAAAKPTLALKGKTLIVTFNPSAGYVGRASSRAIARALAKVLPRK
jgi:Domain of unknown function (DUF4908)